MSKAETQKTALSNGKSVLNFFGFANIEELLDQETHQAEEYLVQIWSRTQKTTTKTFSLPRVEYYTFYSQSINGLPPTSSVVKGHICKG